MDETSSRSYLTVREAAVRLDLAPNTVYDLCRAGTLPHCRVGPRRGRIRITEEDCRAYLSGCRFVPPAPPAAEELAPRPIPTGARPKGPRRVVPPPRAKDGLKHIWP